MPRRRRAARNRIRQTSLAQIAPTPERYRQSKLVLQQTIVAGLAVYRNHDECELDRLRDQIGEARHAAGLKLRALYLEIHPSPGVQTYAKTRIPDNGEISDRHAQIARKLLDLQRSLERHWLCLHRLCCQDSPPSPRLWQPTLDALDALAQQNHLTAITQIDY